MIDELFRKGLLKRAPAARNRIAKSLQAAERYLGDAKKNYEIEAYNIVVIAAYSAMFHAARSILFSDGIAERSHFAVYEYLRERHPELGKSFIEGFNLYRGMRHDTVYELDADATEEEAGEAIKFAGEMIAAVRKKLLK